MKQRLAAILPIFLLILALLVAMGLLWLQHSTASPEDNSPLRITELMCRNSASVTDADGRYCQWIELKNVSDAPLLLSDYSLESGGHRASLPARTLAPGSLILLRQSDWGFPLSTDGSISILRHGVRLSALNYVNRSENCSWLAETGRETGKPTPGYEQVLPADKLQLSEVMSSNADCIVNGQLCDWVEIYNAGSESIELSDYFLSRDEGEPYATRLPERTLHSGEYALLCCGSDIGFNLSKSGCVLYLTRSDGVGASALSVPALSGSESFTYDLGVVSQPSPGRENGSAVPAPTGLFISEVLSSNDSFLPDERGEYSDLVELYNGGGTRVVLSDYCLSDSKNDLFRWTLPSVTLDPGECTVLRCSEGGIGLSSQGERLYLSRSDGTVVDALSIPAIPADRSWGRSGTELVYFTLPSPGASNGRGHAAPVAVPVASVSSGFYDAPFTVTLSGEGSIRYTTDGSTPNEQSRLYTGESIPVSTSMSLRCRAMDGDRIPSETTTYNYLIGQPDYELDTVVVSVAPEHRKQLTQTNNSLEYSANIALYVNGEEEFSLPCGLSLFGSGSRAFMKKSYQIDFQSRYGPGELIYPLFDTRDYDDFDSLALRSGSQDQHHTVMRDEILTTLWAEQSDELLTFAWRPVNLYLNSEYVGVYYIRERCTPETVAEHYGVTPESVSIIKDIRFMYGVAGAEQQEFYDLLEYIRHNDMNDEAAFSYVSERLDMDSTIDFFLSQMWSTNYDIGNARVFRSTEAEDPRWHFILYDLDVAFMRPNDQAVERMVEAYTNLLTHLLKNDGFKERMTLRLGQLLAGPLQEETVLSRIDAMAALLRHDMDYNCRRWAGVYSRNGWEAELDMLKSKPNVGIRDWNDELIRQYIQQVKPEKELIIRAFGPDYC